MTPGLKSLGFIYLDLYVNQHKLAPPLSILVGMSVYLCGSPRKGGSSGWDLKKKKFKPLTVRATKSDNKYINHVRKPNQHDSTDDASLVGTSLARMTVSTDPLKGI